MGKRGEVVMRHLLFSNYSGVGYGYRIQKTWQIYDLDLSPSGGLSIDLSIAGWLFIDLSPAGGHSHDLSPAGGHSHDLSPTAGHSHDLSPAGGGRGWKKSS
jgi:hypothetical protein